MSSHLRVVFAVVAILAGIFATTAVERASFAETIGVSSVLPPMQALHAVASYRAASAPRSTSRLPDRIAAALPENGYAAIGSTDAAHALTSSRLAAPSASVVSRGYDATAPPALS